MYKQIFKMNKRIRTMIECVKSENINSQIGPFEVEKRIMKIYEKHL